MSTISTDIQFNDFLASIKNQVDYDILYALSQEGLKRKDFLEICRRLNRPPNRTELGMFGVMWSEHCCYRNSKSLLQDFPTKGPNILVGPGENAGVIDIGHGQRLVFKIESHNHPSAVEPFQGAATGVGGILRDIFTMGARPIGILNALRFGPLEEEKNKGLLEGVVSGIAHYGNCVGVPTIGGEIAFDKSYSGNPLVNAMALGLMETDEIVKSGAEGIGFSVIYVGSTTGRDGMGGASFASAELTKSSLDNRPAVQVGDPFLEKGLIEACLEAFKNGEVIAAQDMGAAGLTCSCSEMAAKGDVGIELNLDLVPAREEGMTPYEYLLSESQERMLFVVKPGLEDILIKRFRRWGLYVSIVGKVIEEKVVKVTHKNKIVANIPTSALADETPIEKHNLLKDPPQYIQEHWNWKEDSLPSSTIAGISDKNNIYMTWNEVLLKLLDNPSIASKAWIYNQYDYQVQANTILKPGIADAAVIRLRPQEGQDSTVNTNRAVAAVVDCPNRWVYLDPERGSIAAVIEAYRNITCVGGIPLAITDNLNFASPETPIGYWQLAASCRGISLACSAMNTPVTGGNVSLYNETKDLDNNVQPIHPTPIIGMVGLIENIDNICTQSWKESGDNIYLIQIESEYKEENELQITLSGTAYLEYIHGLITGRPPKIEFEAEKLFQAYLIKLIKDKLIKSAHDLSEGGLAVSLAECSISSGLGVDISLQKSSQRIDRLLFAEGGPRVLISASKEAKLKLYEYLNSFNNNSKFKLSLLELGSVTNDDSFSIALNNESIINLSINKIQNYFNNAIPSRMKNQSCS